MKFSEALEMCINDGAKITRTDWNGKEQYVYYVSGRDVPIANWKGDEPTKEEKKRGFVTIAGHFDMRNAQGIRIIGWLATQTDMASDKWEIYESEEDRKKRLKELKIVIDELDKDGFFDTKE